VNATDFGNDDVVAKVQLVAVRSERADVNETPAEVHDGDD